MLGVVVVLALLGCAESTEEARAGATERAASGDGDSIDGGAGDSSAGDPADGTSSARSTAERAAEILGLTMNVQGVEVHVSRAGPAPEDAVGSVLLLHGAAFHSGTWEELGTIERLARESVCVAAVDLPGFGKTPAGADVDDGTFLAELIGALDMGRPVVVSPSMSGRFSFPLIIRRPELVSGFVPVAPVGISDHADALDGLDVPALVIWGEDDAVVPLRWADALASRLSGSRKLILRGARHPAYLDDPETFHTELLSFVREVAGR